MTTNAREGRLPVDSRSPNRNGRILIFALALAVTFGTLTVFTRPRRQHEVYEFGQTSAQVPASWVLVRPIGGSTLVWFHPPKERVLGLALSNKVRPLTSRLEGGPQLERALPSLLSNLAKTMPEADSLRRAKPGWTTFGNNRLLLASHDFVPFTWQEGYLVDASGTRCVKIRILRPPRDGQEFELDRQIDLVLSSVRLK